MPYKAIEHIGEFKIGDIVPDEQAELWKSMYDKSPVEFVVEHTLKEIPVQKEDHEEPKPEPKSESKKHFGFRKGKE